MALTPGEGGGGTFTGSGSTGFNCRISPADEVGIIENLLARIKELEVDVARLKSGNVEASQLSDISQQVGWVGGITYLGTEGWTRTEAGTLIPPPGWSLSSAGLLMSDGTPYQGIVLDENGVLQFGFTANGALAGTKVTQWDSAFGNPIAMYYTADPGSVTGNNAISDIPIIAGYDPDGLLDEISSGIFQVTTSGYYNMTITANISIDSNSSNPSLAQINWTIATGNTNPTFTDPNRGRGPCLVYAFETGGLFFGARFSSSKMMYLKTGVNHSIDAVTTGEGTDFNFNEITLTLQLIKT